MHTSGSSRHATAASATARIGFSPSAFGFAVVRLRRSHAIVSMRRLGGAFFSSFRTDSAATRSSICPNTTKAETVLA